MTEKELINSVQVFRGNCLLNGDKISFADACKVVLLSRILDNRNAFTTREMEVLLKLVQGKRIYWWKFW